VRQAELVRSFSSFFGRDILRLLNSDIEYDRESSWLSDIVRKHRKAFHPLRHLLLMRFLGHPAPSFFAIDAWYKPFGDGPWKCFNGAAEHYLRPVIAQVQVTWSCDTRKALGTFVCSCGFVCSTTDPRQPTGEQFKSGKVKSFGKLWERKLKELAGRRGLGLRETASRLKVDPLTVKRHARRLGIACRWSAQVATDDAGASRDIHETREEVRAKHREIWAGLRRGNARISKAEMRRQAPATYIWLYRHDRSWLDRNSPRRKAIVAPSRRVDWGARDEAVLSRAKDAVKNFLKRSHLCVLLLVKSGRR
jgi:hypothetical protein